MQECSQRTSPGDVAIPRARSFALLIVCLGMLMVVLDGSVVYVALPTIGAALGLTADSLIWVVNAYAIPYGGLLLLTGRLGDYYGHHRLFLVGIILFTLASLACGVAGSSAMLIGARVVQGVAGAMVATVSIPSIMHDFEDPSERAGVMAIYSCIQTFSGSAGILIGGVVTHALSWRWLFLINLPIGVIVCVLARLIRWEKKQERARAPVDLAGAAAITACLVLAIASALNAPEVTWLPVYKWVPLSGALSFLVLFVVIEARIANPIVPLTLFRERNLLASTSAGAVLAGALAIWAFMSALYLQRVLGYDALNLGLSFLPATLTTGLFSLGLSARLVRRFGAKVQLTAGIVVIAAGLLFLARAPSRADYVVDVLPGMLLIGLGTGLATSAYFLCGLSRVGKDDYGIASAILSSSGVLGSAIALAVVAGHAAERVNHYFPATASVQSSPASGYSAALLTAALLAGGAALLSLCIDE